MTISSLDSATVTLQQLIDANKSQPQKLAEQLTAMIAASIQKASNQVGSDQSQSIAHIPFGVSKICSVQPLVLMLPISQASFRFTKLILILSTLKYYYETS